MTTDDQMALANAEARRRFDEAAAEYRTNLEDQWEEALPGNHSPAQAAILAHLITMHDGYNDVQYRGEWDQRAKTGWQCSVCYLPSIEPRLFVDFAIEARSEQATRQLAIIIDSDRPGERTPEKRAAESRLVALGFRVLVFSEVEATLSAASCRERIESIIFHMMEETMVEAGFIKGREDA